MAISGWGGEMYIDEAAHCWNPITPAELPTAKQIREGTGSQPCLIWEKITGRHTGDPRLQHDGLAETLAQPRREEQAAFLSTGARGQALQATLRTMYGDALARDCFPHIDSLSLWPTCQCSGDMTVVDFCLNLGITEESAEDVLRGTVLEQLTGTLTRENNRFRPLSSVLALGGLNIHQIHGIYVGNRRIVTDNFARRETIAPEEYADRGTA